MKSYNKRKTSFLHDSLSETSLCAEYFFFVLEKFIIVGAFNDNIRLVNLSDNELLFRYLCDHYDFLLLE